MSRRLGFAALTLTLLACACGRVKSAAHRSIPAGEAIWFSQRLEVGQAETEEILARGGFTYMFLPALQLGREGSDWKVAQVPPPGRPVGASVVLVVKPEAGAESAGALSAETAPAAGVSIGAALKGVLAHRNAFGRIVGLHLDLPFTAATSAGLRALTESLRPSIPRDLFLTCSLRFVPTEDERKEFVKNTAQVDGFVAWVFGPGDHAGTVATDELGKPWWAGYGPGARGQWTDASGGGKGWLTEKQLGPLTDDARVTLGNDMAVREEGVAGFVFRPTAAVEIAGLSFAPGDQILYQQPLLSELIYRFGSDLAGRRLVRGRLVVLDGGSDSERIFTLAELSDIILGRPLLPDLQVSVTADANGARISAENRTAHASVISRTSNWVEVDVPSGHIRDVQLGGFDRYEVFDSDGQPVTPGRATRVRFYETLVGPRERIADAAILLRTRPGPDCCRFRQHLLAAAGTELSGDWSAPPVPPTPVPVAKTKPKARPRKR